MRGTILFVVLLIAGAVVAPAALPDQATPVTPSSPGVLPGQAARPNASGPAAGTMTDIIDIKPLVPIGFNTEIILYAIIAAVCILLAVLAFLFLRRHFKRRGEGGELIEPLVPPWESAAGAIKEIEAGGMNDCREFYFRITAVFKAYLKGRFGMDAPEMTTEELLPRINELPVDRELMSGARDLLRRSDLVKFAGVPETRERMATDLGFVRAFVEKTIPAFPQSR